MQNQPKYKRILLKLSGEALAKELNGRGLEGVFFVPKYYMSPVLVSEEKGGSTELCDGVMMVIHDRNAWRPVLTQLHIMDALIKLYPEITNLDRKGSKRTRYAHVRMGTDKICELADAHESLEPVMDEWAKGAEDFMKRREKYLLY